MSTPTASVASFHLVRHRSRLAAMTHLGVGRRRLASTGGLAFWRLLGTGAGHHTGPGADLTRTAVFAIWRDEPSLDEFLTAPPWGDDVVESWHVGLRAQGGHGAWRGRAVLDDIQPAIGGGSGAVAIITRADVRVRSWWDFRAAGVPVDAELHQADGLLDVVGIGEAPVGRLGTFSLWRSVDDARAFAAMPRHRRVVADTRRGRWYREELFARFEPYRSAGCWDGRDPLAPFASTGSSMP